MNYEEKYKYALKRAEAVIKVAQNQKEVYGCITTIFPELKENEEEQSKEWILEYLRDGLQKSDEQFKGQFKAAINWLEKQGEPDGKRAEWINGVLTLVDEPKVDNRPVTERIKTFEDACNGLNRMAEKGDETAADLLADYESNSDNILVTQTLATMKLSIIAYALNEGWEPKFEKGECRYSPCFYLYTKEQYDELDEEKKGRCVPCSGRGTLSYSDFANCVAINDDSHSNTSVGSRLSFRTRELAAYAGGQFTEEWADFIF